MTGVLASLPKWEWDADPNLFHYPEWMSFMPGDGIRYYSLLYVCVFLGGYKLLDWQLRRAGAGEEDGSDFVMYGVIAVLGGARIGHVFFYEFERFQEDPMWLFRIWEGGLASHGATVGLAIAMWLFCKLRRQSFVEGSDRFAYSAALGAGLVRLGNFMNSEIVGRATDQSWGVRFMRYDGGRELRHPSQLYEFFLGALVMLVLWIADNAMGKEKRPRGAMISIFFLVYFTGRFFVEYFKEYQVDAEALAGGLTRGQQLSIPLILVGVVGLIVSFKKNIPAHWNVPKMPGADDEENDPGAKDDDVDDVLLGTDDDRDDDAPESGKSDDSDDTADEEPKPKKSE